MALRLKNLIVRSSFHSTTSVWEATTENVAKISEVVKTMRCDGHVALSLDKKQGKWPCIICRLDYNFCKRSPTIEADTVGIRRNVVKCARCNVHLHNCSLTTKCWVHEFGPFRHMTCFEIFHSDEGRLIWKTTGTAKHRYNVCLKSQTARDLRETYGLDADVIRTTKKRNDLGAGAASKVVDLDERPLDIEDDLPSDDDSITTEERMV